MKAVVTEHHYNDISGAAQVLADEGIELVVGNCRTEDDAIAQDVLDEMKALGLYGLSIPGNTAAWPSMGTTTSMSRR